MPASTPLLGSAELGTQVEQLREQNLLLREEHDALSPEDVAQRAGLESSLTQGRVQMIGLLQQRRRKSANWKIVSLGFRLFCSPDGTIPG